MILLPRALTDLLAGALQTSHGQKQTMMPCPGDGGGKTPPQSCHIKRIAVPFAAVQTSALAWPLSRPEALLAWQHLPEQPAAPVKASEFQCPLHLPTAETLHSGSAGKHASEACLRSSEAE